MRMNRLLVLIILLLIPLQLLALDVPQLGGRVNDYARMLSPQAVSRLEQTLASFERDQSTQVVVLTIPSLQGDDIDQFTIRVAEQWKIGQRGKDNGILLILAQAERKVRIEVGRGLQGVLPDITAGRIIRDVMRPHLKDGNFDQGVSAGVDAIIAATKGEFKADPKDQPKKQQRKSSSLTFFLLAAVAAAILGTFSRYLGGAAGAAGLPLAAFFAFPALSLVTLAILAAVGFAVGLLLSMLLSGLFGGGGGGGGFYGGGWGGGFYGGGSSGGSSGDSGSFSGGGGEFDGGGSSDDY